MKVDWLQVVEEFRGEIQSDIESVSKAVVESASETRTIAEQEGKFSDDVESVEREIRQRTSELKQMVDRQADCLLREVNAARQLRKEKVAKHMNDMELNRLVLVDFQKYSQQLNDKGTVDWDCCQCRAAVVNVNIFTARPHCSQCRALY